MFKHQNEEVIPKNIESYDVNDDIVTASDLGNDAKDIVNDADEMNDHESANRTISNPSQLDKNGQKKFFDKTQE